MYYINETQETNNRPGGEREETMRTRQMREARRRLTEEFVGLLRLRPEDGARWTGPVCDLMEAAHIVYGQGTVVDDEGCVCTFAELARRICAVLNVRLPSNPRCAATRAAMRKGVRRGPLIDRYVWQLFHSGIEHPLMRNVAR